MSFWKRLTVNRMFEVGSRRTMRDMREMGYSVPNTSGSPAPSNEPGSYGPDGYTEYLQFGDILDGTKPLKPGV